MSIIIECKCVKILRKRSVFYVKRGKIHFTFSHVQYFFFKIVTNLTFRCNNEANTPEWLHCADFYEVWTIRRAFLNLVINRRQTDAMCTLCKLREFITPSVGQFPNVRWSHMHLRRDTEYRSTRTSSKSSTLNGPSNL